MKTIKAAISLLLLSSVSALADNAASTSSTSSLPMIIAMTSGEKPAVDGVNGKVDVFGGAGQSNAISVMSIDGLSPYIQNPNAYWNGLGGAIGTITIPVGHQFGAQIDLGAGTFSNRANGSAAGHFFWRDPEQGLIGVYGSGIYSTRGEGRKMWNIAGEFEKYIGNWTARALLGVQGFGFNTTYNAPSGTPTIFSQPDRFFDKVSLTYYPNADLALTIRHIYSKNTNSINGEIEYIAPQFRGDKIAPSAYLSASYGWNNASVIMAGIRVYFGNHDKSLIQRHREDDPFSHGNISHQSGSGLSPSQLQAIEAAAKAYVLGNTLRVNNSMANINALHFP